MMRWVLWSTIFAFAIDQISKYVVIHMMDLSRIRVIDVLPPLLTFRYGENRGINFGLLSNGAEASRILLIVLALVICAVVLVWVRRSPMRPVALVSAGMLVGGALANVVDRVLYGYVLDFLNTSCCGLNNPFVFNIADIFIFAGALGLVIFTGDAKKPAPGTRKTGR